MSKQDARAAAAAVGKLAERLAQEPRLQAEIQRARRDFFGNAAAGPAVPGAGDAAELRFCEWFGLERECDTFGGVPAELPRFGVESIDLGGTIAGVFSVLATTKEGVAARDLQDQAALDLWVPEGSLQPGDLVVGRLFPTGPGAYTPSTAAAVFRPGKELAAAFQRDMQRVALDRRLYQIELEHLLLRRPDQRISPTSGGEPPVPLEHLEADLEQMLQSAESELSATAISQQLAVAVRPGQVLGPLLEELAFDTDIDLDKVRALLMLIWNAHHHEDEQELPSTAPIEIRPAPGETLGEQLVRTLDEGLQQKRDVAELFAQLERMAGIEPEAEPDDPLAPPRETADERYADDEDRDDDGDTDRDDDDDRGSRARFAARGDDEDGDDLGAEDAEEVVAASDEEDGEAADDYGEADEGIAGNLLPLVEEFLWETHQADLPIAATLRSFARLQGNAPVPHSDLDAITSADVMRFLLHAFLGAAPAERAGAATAAFGCVGEFFHWAEQTQELTLRPVLAGCQGPLLEQMPRLEAAGLVLATPPRPGLRPGILQVEDVDDGGFGVRDDDGDHHWIDAPAAATAHLRVGDLMLAALQPGPKGRQLIGPVVVLPNDARTLME